jgi:large subunit ribosomal protein L21
MGETVDIDLLDVKDGDQIELNKVLLIADDKKVTVGTPAIEGAKVVATSQGLKNGEKIIVLRFKNKARSTRKTGHRQKYTRLSIDEIVVPDSNKN